MIKRRFYKLDHGDRDAPSESSSSSSDSELEAEATEEDEQDHEQENHEKEEDDDNDDDNYKDNNDDYKNKTITEMQKQNLAGYESGDSSGREVNLDSSGLPTSDDDIGTINDRKSISENHLFGRGIGESDNIQHKTVAEQDDMPCERSKYILKHKSVFKCRICPRIICLSEETLNTHLKSKRHARSEKLLKEGRLKLMLNDDGNIYGEEEHSSKRKEKKVQVTERKKGFKRQRWGKRSRKERKLFKHG